MIIRGMAQRFAMLIPAIGRAARFGDYDNTRGRTAH
jgi:hypothetical protein